MSDPDDASGGGSPPPQRDPSPEAQPPARDTRPDAQPPSQGAEIDVTLTELAVSLRQLIATLRSQKVSDPRLDRSEERLEALLRGRLPSA